MEVRARFLLFALSVASLLTGFRGISAGRELSGFGERGGGRSSSYAAKGSRGGKSLGFKIGGVEVTEDNVGSLSNPAVFPALKRGTLSYLEGANILTGVGVTLVSEDAPLIENVSIDGLRIELSDEVDGQVLKTACELSSRGAPAFRFLENTILSTRIHGDRLRVSSDGDAAIRIGKGKRLQIEKGDLDRADRTAPSYISLMGEWGITGVEGEEEGGNVELVYESDLRIESRNQCIYKIAGLKYWDIFEVLHPYGATLKGGTLTDLNGVEVRGFSLIGSERTHLGVTLINSYSGNLREQVVSKRFMHSHKSLGIEYDESRGALVLSNFCFESDNPGSLMIDREWLDIELRGVSRLAQVTPIIPGLLGKGLHIYGDGALIVNSHDAKDATHGLCARQLLRISGDASVYAHGLKGVCGSILATHEASLNLEVTGGAKLVAFRGASSTTSAVGDLQSLKLGDGVKVQHPSGHTLSAPDAGGAILDGNGEYASAVLIGAPAEESYGFSLNGLAVSRYTLPFLRMACRNADAIRFDPAGGELLLKGCSIHKTHPMVETKGLEVSKGSWLKRIRIEDATSLINDGFASPAMQLDESVTLTGNGVLYMYSYGSAIRLGQDVRLTVDGITLLTDQKNSALAGDGSNSASLELLSGASVQLSAPVSGAVTVTNLRELLTPGGTLHEPSGGSLKGGSIVGKDGAAHMGDVHIGPSESTQYGFELCGTAITNVNARLSFEKVTRGKGRIDFDPATGTLTLESCELDGLKFPFLNVLENSLLKRIVVRNKNWIESDEDIPLIRLASPITITDVGSLTLFGHTGISFQKDVTLNLEGGVRLFVAGNDTGIRGTHTKGGALALRDAYLGAVGAGNGAIIDLHSCVIDARMGVYAPEGAKFDASKGAFCDKDGNIFTGDLKDAYLGISPHSYGIGIGAVAIDAYTHPELNSPIHFPCLREGELQYDIASRTLTLRDVVLNDLDFEEGWHGFTFGALLNLRGEVTVVLEGRNRLETWSIVPIHIEENSNVTVKGPGVLTATAHVNESFSSLAPVVMAGGGVSMSLRAGAKVIAQSERPLWGKNETSVLTVGDQASLLLKGEIPSERILVKLGAGTQITKPAETTFDESTLLFLHEGEQLYGLNVQIGNSVPEEEPSITLSHDRLVLYTNFAEKGSAILKSTITPRSMPQGVIWQTDNPGVATVSRSGLVTAKGKGTARITVQSPLVDKLRAECEVIVTEYTPIETIMLKPDKMTLHPGDEVDLEVDVTPTGASLLDLKWSSSDGNVATVSESGLVVGVAKGKATITATSVSDPTKFAACQVEVVIPVLPTRIALSKRELDLKQSQRERLTVTFEPEGVTRTDVTWHSDKPSVASVDGGVVTARGVGEARIRVTSVAVPTVTAECVVRVAPRVAVEGIALDKTGLSLDVGGEELLTVTFTPSNPTDKGITWSSSSEGVAKVQDGLVTAISAGEATITARSHDGGKTATCLVTVSNTKDKKSSVGSSLLGTVAVSPNPFSGVLRVRNAESVTGYSLVGSSGAILLQGSHDGGESLTLGTSHLPEGLYLLRLDARDGARAFRVLKR